MVNYQVAPFDLSPAIRCCHRVQTAFDPSHQRGYRADPRRDLPSPPFWSL